MTLRQSLTGLRTSVANWLRPVDSGPVRMGLGIIREPYTGAWQCNVEARYDSVVSNPTVFACVTLIAADIGKLRARLLQRRGKVWPEVENSAYSAMLREPNAYQTWQQFAENWIQSKLLRGNAYVLKQRDASGRVARLYVLDPNTVTPLVADDGSVYYQITRDNLAGITEGMLQSGRLVVPAREIIHDRMNCLFHPLVGLSPIFAAGLPAIQGMAIASQSTKFFQNASRPGGILIAPGAISEDDAKRLKEQFETGFGGEAVGRLAVVGDGMKYQALNVSAADAQLIDQLKWTAETICSVFHVPGFKIGIGQMPTYQNGETLNQIYYSDCLQSLIEAVENCLNAGLGLSNDLGIELDTRALLRMDTAARYTAHSEAIKGGWLSPNEARQAEDLPPVDGGDTPYLQQQNYSLAALARRDSASPAPSSTSSTGSA